MSEFDFVRDSTTPEAFDGRWQVWRGVVCFGVVRKSSDPIKKHEAWGYEAKPTKRYPNGSKCEGGFRTRLDAARALRERMRDD